jgi:hypothetical protein
VHKNPFRSGILNEAPRIGVLQRKTENSFVRRTVWARKTIYIGFLKSAASGSWVQPPICPAKSISLRPFNSEFVVLRNRWAAGNTEFTQAHGILDVFEESSFMNNAQLHTWAINEQHNEKEIT